MSTKQKWIQAIAMFSLTLLVGCTANIKRVEIPEGKPTEEVMASLDQLMTEAYNAHADLLAPQDFTKGKRAYTKAREELKEKQVEVTNFREQAGYSTAYLERAIKEATNKKPEALEVIEAREAAINAGVRKNHHLNKELKKLDEDYIFNTSTIGWTMTPQKYAKLQKRYLDLEIATVQSRELDKAKVIIENAEDAYAKSKAPISLKEAKTHVITAENVIATNVRTPKNYKESVDRALTSSLMLMDVMATIKNRGGDLDESVAIELVNKDHQLSDQSKRIAALRTEVFKAEEEIGSLGTEITEKEKKLKAAAQVISLQQAIDEVRKEIPEQDAEVYQQGNKLTIRLKKINFTSGSHQVPNESLPMLFKLEKIISKVNPDEILVEGHTDSTGSDQINKEISERRAESVANILKTDGEFEDVEFKGMGESKPLTANNTKEGRATNRRVDIIVKTKKE